VQRDPREYVDGSNLYSYVHSSPVYAVDPRGTKTWYVRSTGSWWLASWGYGWSDYYLMGATRNFAKVDTDDCCEIEFNRSLDMSTPSYKHKIRGWILEQWMSFDTIAVGDVSSKACECDGAKVDGIEVNVYHVFAATELATIEVGASAGAEVGVTENAKVTAAVNVSVTIPPASYQSKAIATYLICPTGDAGSVPSIVDKGWVGGRNDWSNMEHRVEKGAPLVLDAPR
jgi:hypothetical protein